MLPYYDLILATIEAHGYWLAVVLVAWLTAWSGAGNALVYEREGPERSESRLPRWLGVHEHEALEIYPFYLLVVLAGLDLIHVIGSALVGSLPFKGFINLAYGLPFVNPDETSDPDNDGRTGWTVFGVAVPSPFVGRGRYLAVALGVVLWCYRPLLNLAGLL